ncbi:MAG: hypothetical protein ACRDZU_04585 [Acidimicrobiales bacterium]
MAAERYVLLGLAQVRSAWFRDLSRSSTSASLPIEFLKAMSVEEVRVRLRSGRGYSALVIDDTITGLDRDLVDLALEVGCAVIVIDSGRAVVSWSDLGISAVLPTEFGRGELLQVLAQVATPITRSDESAAPPTGSNGSIGYRGCLVAVTGPSGAGRSTVSMAVAQGLAADARHADLVCLADLALHADHAMLHASLDVVPGVVELVDAHRGGEPTIDSIHALTWWVEERGYHLLLGLRRHRDWTLIRPRAFESALDGLRRSFRVVVADIDDDLEGERISGSLDVEDRNVMARSVVHAADLVLVVGAPGMKGLHSMLRVVRDVLDHGVPGDRVLPIINRAPRSPRSRAELTRSFGDLLTASTRGARVPTPMHLPVRRNMDQLLRDGARFPEPWCAPVCGPVLAVLDGAEPHHDETAPAFPEPMAIAPGSLGSWTEQASDSSEEGIS